MSFLKEVYDYLIAQGVGTSSNMFYGYMPDEPFNNLTIFEYAGRTEIETADHKIIKRPGLQVKVRYLEDYDLAWNWIRQAETTLRAAQDVVLGTTKYLCFEPLQEIFPLGWDGNRCITLAQNFGVQRSE